MTPPLSIVIPSLDCPLVDRTLGALLGQQGMEADIEVLVVGRDAHRLVPENGSVRFIETEEPLSAAAARNRGVDASRADRILFTDADCRPDPDWAARLFQALERHPVVGGSVRFALTGNLWAVADNIASFNNLLGDRPAGASSRQILGSLNLGVRREAWERVGTFDEGLPTSEDHDWILRASGAGLESFFDPSAVVEHADVRRSRRDLEDHAAWYGRHFNRFREKHPGVFDCGPTWRSRRRLATSAALKSWVSALKIFLHHPILLPGWRAFPGVVIFKQAWYRAVLDSWQEP